MLRAGKNLKVRRLNKRTRSELHSDRLGTTDEKGHRIYLFPEDVKGPWRNRRVLVFWVLILIYFVLPWIYYQGKQVILLDIANREFTFFGNIFYGHDAPLVFFIFVISVLAFGFITSQWGRAWCGWACPQTVFIDGVFSRIERLIEGKARKRRELSRASLSMDKFFKKSLKWFIFTIISLHLSHTFLGYFVGTREMLAISMHSPLDNLNLFITMLTVTGILLFDFGWFKEQFCIIACPYGKIQSVMMDEESLVIAYDKKRGEPRRGLESDSDEGDCIDCMACVKVCPTGIDIRRGTQLECITCTNCIDACDDIMTKMKRDKGLIRYDSETSIEGKERKFWRVRPIIYLIAMTIAISLFSYKLIERKSLTVEFIRGSKSPYQVINKKGLEKQIVNHYKIALYYQGDKKHKLFFEIPQKEFKLVTRSVPFEVKKGLRQTVDIFIKFHKNALDNGRKLIKIRITSGETATSAVLLREEEVKIVGPF